MKKIALSLILILLPFSLFAQQNDSTRVAEIVTTIIGSGTIDDPYRPAISSKHKILSYEDIVAASNISKGPNAYVVKVRVNPSELEKIDKDSSEAVLWEEREVKIKGKREKKEKREFPTVIERRKLKTKLKRLGLKQAEVDSLIDSGRFREVIAKRLKSFIKKRKEEAKKLKKNPSSPIVEPTIKDQG